MPIFSLTPRQRKAFEVLTWLHSVDDSSRRTGRSFVMALSLLHEMVVTQRYHWIDIVDHVATHGSNNFLKEGVLQIAEGLGIFSSIEQNRTSVARIRIRPGYQIPPEVIEALTVFGNIAETVPMFPTPEQEALEPKRTLWDCLTEEED